MPRKPSKTKKIAKGHHAKTRPSVKPHALRRTSLPQQIGTAAGRLADRVVTDMMRPVVRNTSLPVSYVSAGNGSSVFDTAARITGGALAVGSILITAPIMFVMQAYMMTREVRAQGDDLKSRKYVDEAGRVHHHTRTFMRDHPSELRTLAA